MLNFCNNYKKILKAANLIKNICIKKINTKKKLLVWRKWNMKELPLKKSVL